MTSAAHEEALTTSAMIASFADPGQKTTPAPFGHALNQLAEQRPEIVGLSADLAKYTDMHVFRDKHPERFFQMGMSEQSLLGTAAGLAEVGLVPFASTYSVFATRRAYDFLCLDIAEPGLNVNVVGALPGLTTGYGPSHQATEDLAILRGCPGLTIVDPCDAVDIEQAVPALADVRRSDVPATAARRGAPGPRRVRLHLRARQGRRAAHRPRRRPHLHRPDDDARPAGGRPARGRPRRRRGAARADHQAARHRGDPRRRPHRPAGASPCENHTVVGGLAESVASTLAFAGVGNRIVPVALPDEFLAAGALPTLHDRYGLSTDSIVSRVRAELQSSGTNAGDVGEPPSL